MLDLRHNDGRRENHAKTERFLYEQIAGREHTMRGSHELPEDKSTADSKSRHESGVNQETPARRQPARSPPSCKKILEGRPSEGGGVRGGTAEESGKGSMSNDHLEERHPALIRVRRARWITVSGLAI